MYSRAPRTLYEPSRTNPSLGPGCYTADESSLIAGKSLNESTYAPFASLAPRVSVFDELINLGPAPGAYDPPSVPVSSLHPAEKSVLFGKSQAPRFKQIVSATPGPGSYLIRGTLGRGGGIVGGEEDDVGGGSGKEKHKPVALLKVSGRRNGKRVGGGGGVGGVRDVGDGGDGGGYYDEVDVDDDDDDDDDVDDDDGYGNSGPRLEAIKTPKVTNFTPQQRTSQETAAGEHQESGEIVGPEADPNQQPPTIGADGQAELASAPLKKRKKRRQIRHESLPGSARKPAIVWRRKFVPPSIPVGESAFGYKENAEGELVPRKPPKKNLDSGPAYNFISSFVEKAKHENHGYRFAKESKGLKFKVTDSPGPGMYDMIKSERYLHAKEAMKGPAVMTLAPCTRMTDEIVADAVKKGVPGPGAYDGKLQIKNPRTRGTNIPGFGASSNHEALTNYIPQDQMHTPGPGAYYPEFASLHRPTAIKAQPFGSTMSRFDTTNEKRVKALPAPGSYDLDAIDSLVQRVQKKIGVATAVTGARPKAFGSVADRFRYSQATQVRATEPGPGQYETAHIPPAPPRVSSADRKKRALQKIKDIAQVAINPNTRAPTAVTTTTTNAANGAGGGGKLISRTRQRPVASPGRPVTHESILNGAPVVGGVKLDPEMKLRIPAFGTQTDRFADALSDLPPPGAYEIAQAFESLTTKGRVEKKSFMASQMQRELFKVPYNMPGPGEYDTETKESTPIQPRAIKNGGFLSSMKRFDDKREPVPGPGAYLSPEHDSGLIKKSFNITLGDFDGTTPAKPTIKA